MMFGRLLWRLVRGNRGRLAVALLAMASGGDVLPPAARTSSAAVSAGQREQLRALGYLP